MLVGQSQVPSQNSSAPSETLGWLCRSQAQAGEKPSNYTLSSRLLYDPTKLWFGNSIWQALLNLTVAGSGWLLYPVCIFYFNYAALWQSPVHFNQSEAPFASSMRSSVLLRIWQRENNHRDRYKKWLPKSNHVAFPISKSGKAAHFCNIQILRSTNTRRVFTNERSLRFRLAANPYNLALTESLAVDIKFLFRNNTAYMIPLTENILPLHWRLSMDEN